MIRNKTKTIKIGNILIGGNNKIAIQSMCTTKTKDVQATIEQIQELTIAGCEIVRVAVLDLSDARAILEIKKQITIPIVADIHFDYRLALAAIDAGADKLRINPGNIGSLSKLKLVVNRCKEKNIPIRIGVNLGSLDKEIEKTYGRTATALVESARKHILMLEDLDFHNIVVSIKASDIFITQDAYKLASSQFNYPLHIGITEAGTEYLGTIKSAIGIGILINEGIGDTIRVSLTSNPLEEIKAAKAILSVFGYISKPTLISCPMCGRTQYNMYPIIKEIETFMETLPEIPFKIAIMGCAVNGPGEAKDADIGIAGGINEVLLFKKGKIIKKVPEDEIAIILKEEIIKMIKEIS